MTRKTLALGAAVAALGVAPASAQMLEGQSAAVDAESGPIHMAFDATKVDGVTSGTFAGEVKLGGRLADVAGPVTCLEVSGNTISLFYPVETVHPEIMKAAIKGMYVTIKLNDAGTNVTGMGFAPSGLSTASECSAKGPLLGAHGTGRAH